MLGRIQDFEYQFKQLGLTLSDVKKLLEHEEKGLYQVSKVQTQYEKKEGNVRWTKVKEPLFNGNHTKGMSISEYLDFELLVGCFENKTYEIEELRVSKYRDTHYVSRIVFYTPNKKYKYIVEYKLI